MIRNISMQLKRAYVALICVFFKVAMRVNLSWATKTLQVWAKIPENHNFTWSELWRSSVSHGLQPLLARLNSRQLCLYCQWILWEGEPHEECDRQFEREQDLLDGEQLIDYDGQGDPYKDTSDDQPDCPPEDPFENVPNEDPEGEEDY